MKITDVETFRIAVPLKKPFKTALRTVSIAESVVVKMTIENQIICWGEAPPTVVITGESAESIDAAIHNVLKPFLIGKSLLNYEAILQDMNLLLIHNSSAKAAVDMAVYDGLSQYCGIPLYQFLGGYRNQLETDYTVSVNSPKEMAEDAERYIAEGFQVLKIKVGKDSIYKDIERIKEIRSRIGKDIKIRLDANQGWSVKEAIFAIRKMEDIGFGIELIEQPVHKDDIEGLKAVTDAVETLIMADESVFAEKQAFQILQTRSADLINIKLMKAGGIHRAAKINALAEACGVECMVGSMIETKIGISAAAHFAASKKNITRYDFDAPLMLKEERIVGGIEYTGRTISFFDRPGLGISQVHTRKEQTQ
ncbi:dipeptide epimerase [Bacillus gobiensis]|uniref:dipeptide epimerase n=1 Tax=Bacillus gobiensis TaxID=1441095 RepID=UPI003D2095F4